MSPSSQDPAQGAAELLRRFGLAMLGVAFPCAAFYSRRAAILLLPLGAILIFMGAVIDPAEPITTRLKEFAGRRRTILMAALAAWGAATILWSPFPASSAERFYNTVGVIAAAAAAMAAIPQRMRAPALYFLPVGAFAAVVTACLLALEGRGAIHIGLGYDPVLAARGAAALALLTPVAMGWLLSRRRAPECAALAIGVVCATFVLDDTASSAVLLIMLAAFLLARVGGRPMAILLGGLAALFVIAAPLLVFVVQPAARALGFEDVASLMLGLNDSILREGLRMVTGHGLETTPRAISAGILPAFASPPLLVALWFDLGLVGALAVGGLAAMRAPEDAQTPDVAAAEIALLWAVLAQMFFGVAALQAWWLSSFAAALIALRAVAFGQFRTRRPRVRLFSAKPPDADR